MSTSPVCRARFVGLVVLSAILLVAAQGSQAAPMAKITAVTLQVYYRPGPKGPTRWCKVGDLLPPGSLVVTRKRSACEIRFPDGSRLRMGARSELVIRDVATKHVQVVSGEVFAKIISGTGGQIRGATATAAIKGTWVLFQGPTQPGQEPPRGFDTCSVWHGQVIFSSPQGSTPVGYGQTASAGPGIGPPRALPGFAYAFGDGSFSPGYSHAIGGNTVLSTPGTIAGDWVKDQQSSARSSLEWLMSGWGRTGTVPVHIEAAYPAAGGPWPMGGLAPSLSPMALAAAGALGGEEGARGILGRKFFGINSELDIVGALYSGGSLGGLRARASTIRGHYYGEIGLEGFTDFGGTTASRLSDLFVDDRLGNTDVTVGRQRYLEGPVNNNGIGSLFGDIHFDGVSYKHIDRSYTIKLAWLEQFDTYDRLPDSDHGWLGRVQVPLLGGEVALNALQQEADGWGFSGDVSLPVIPHQLDMYAELGCDPRGRHLSTYGAYFPGLYQSHNVDLFVERAQRGTDPAVWSALAYADLSHGWTGLAGYQKTQGGDSECLVGFVKSFGHLSY